MAKINVGVEEWLGNHHSCVLRAQCKFNMFKDALNKAAVNLVVCVWTDEGNISSFFRNLDDSCSKKNGY